MVNYYYRMQVKKDGSFVSIKNPNGMKIMATKEVATKTPAGKGMAWVQFDVENGNVLDVITEDKSFAFPLATGKMVIYSHGDG